MPVLFLCLSFCSSEPTGECWLNAKDKIQGMHPQENVSVSSKSKLQKSKDRKDAPLSHDELLEHSANKSEELSQGELVLTLAPKQMQPARGLSVDQTATTPPVDGSTAPVRSSGGPERDEDHCNQTKGDDAVLAQPTSLVYSSPLILSDEPRVSDLTQDHSVGGESSPWSPVQKSEPEEATVRPSSVQSDDFLPTFTSQRPPYLATRSSSSNSTMKQRYGAKRYKFLNIPTSDLYARRNLPPDPV